MEKKEKFFCKKWEKKSIFLFIGVPIWSQNDLDENKRERKTNTFSNLINNEFELKGEFFSENKKGNMYAEKWVSFK